MTYDPVEQEEALREWWRRHGKRVVTAILLALAAILAGQWWFQQQAVTRANASVLYGQMTQALESERLDQAQSLGGKLMEEYGDTPYAVFAALAVARLEVDAGQLPQAAQRLQWALERADALPAGADLVRLRLARVQLAQGQHDAALATLNAIQTGAFNGVAAALRGDIYLQQGQRDKARTAYRTALGDPAIGNQQRTLLEMKLDELGEGEPAS